MPNRSAVVLSAVPAIVKGSDPFNVKEEKLEKTGTFNAGRQL